MHSRLQLRSSLGRLLSWVRQGEIFYQGKIALNLKRGIDPASANFPVLLGLSHLQMSRERITLNIIYLCQNSLALSAVHLALLRYYERIASITLYICQVAGFPLFQHKKNFNVQAEISLFENTVISRRQQTK